MALILEVVDGKSGALLTRAGLGTLPFTLGRGYGNDLILDDPYVDANHAWILVDETGAPVLEDRGSVNGLSVAGRPERRERIALAPGTEVRIGRTILRVRDSEAPVPAALPDIVVQAVPAPAIPRARARLLVCAAAVIVFPVYTWAGSYARDTGSDVIGAAFAFLVTAAVWAGIWAIASRVAVHRFNFMAHFAVASAAALATLAVVMVSDWSEFLFPGNPVRSPLASVLLLLVVTGVVSAHLSLASTMPRSRRRRAGLITSLVLVVVIAFSALVQTETFSDVPAFSGVLKPVPTSLMPTGTVDDLRAVAADLKTSVDKLAAK